MKAPEEVAELNVVKSCHMFLSGWQQLKETLSKESLGEPALSSSRPLPDDLRMSAVLCVVSPVARTFYRVGNAEADT